MSCPPCCTSGLEDAPGRSSYLEGWGLVRLRGLTALQYLPQPRGLRFSYTTKDWSMSAASLRCGTST